MITSVRSGIWSVKTSKATIPLARGGWTEAHRNSNQRNKKRPIANSTTNMPNLKANLPIVFIPPLDKQLFKENRTTRRNG
jgi:hypothetical protein